jgi:hypothetical protein
MKKTILIAGAILSTTLLCAQTTEQPVKVRIKKVENINGVEKVTDTTFTTTDISSLHREHPNIKVCELGEGKEGKIEKVIINGDDIKPEDIDVRIIRNSDDMDKEIQKVLKEAGMDENTKGTKKVVIVHDDAAGHENAKGERKMTKIVMVKMDMTDATESDKKRLRSQIGDTDDKLEVEKMAVYPNPAGGKFNLKFNLKNKADAEITIYNADGTPVYTEKLPAFSGEYNKPIDISQNSKGVYFVKVVQGKHSMVKKVVME